MDEIEAKKKPVVPIVVAAVIVFLLILGAVFYAVAGSPAAKTKKSIELSKKYLAELNYEQAALAFESVLELDPLCVEAYLGLSEAYVGMADAAIEAGDTEKAEALYVKAMEALDAGYEATQDASIAEKLEEIEAIYEEEFIVEEPETSDKSETQSDGNGAYVPTGEYPFVSIKEMVESATLEGRMWYEWTADELISYHGLTQRLEMMSSGEHIYYAEPSNIYGAMVGTSDGKYVYKWSKKLGPDSARVAPDMIYHEDTSENGGGKSYSQMIVSYDQEVFHESIGGYCLDHAFTNIAAIKQAFKFDELAGENLSIMVETEYGVANVGRSDIDDYFYFTITNADNTKTSFYFYDYAQSFSIEISIFQ